MPNNLRGALETNEKRISVVIPVHNAEAALDECLDTLFKTNYKNFEVIVVDDCSIDNSIGIAKKYPCKIIGLSEQRGPAYARNKGLSSVSGEIVAFIDSDCIVPRDWLDKINTKLTHNNIGMGGKYVLSETIKAIPGLFMASWDFKNFLYTKPTALVSLSGGNCAFWKFVLLRERKKSELVYCNRSVGGDDTIMCCELSRFGKIIYDPDLYVIHAKKCSLLGIMKEAINLGYSGAIVARLYSSLLLKEPHRFYKTILYIMSISLLFMTLLLPLTHILPIYISFVIFYIVAQLPIIAQGGKYLPRNGYKLFFPIITFINDLFHLIGHVKWIWHIIKKRIKSIIWYIKLAVKTINPSALFRLFFFVTKKCNADCYFCFNKKGYQAYQEEDLSFEEIKKISANIGFLPWLTITGGEPFLRKDLYQLCRLFYLNCDTKIISIVTNGASPLFIEEVVEKLLIDCDRLDLTIIIALDDIGEKHDQIKSVKNCYMQALKTLERLNLLQSRFPRLTLGINTTIIKENADHIEEILDYFSNNLFYDRQCLNLLRKPPCTGVDQRLISIQKYSDLVKSKTFFEGKSARNSQSIKQRFNRTLLEYVCERFREDLKLKSAKSICLAAQKFFVIDNNGDIFACELLLEKLGNLRDQAYDLKKIIKNLKVKKVRMKIRNTKCYCLWPCAIASNIYLRGSSYTKIITNMICSCFPNTKIRDGISLKSLQQ